jgi:hypothetical protein
MRTGAILLSIALTGAGTTALAQNAGDPIAALRACTQLDGAARVDCLEKLSRDIAPPPRAAPRATAPAADGWIISETTSPVDYTPMVVATTHGRAGADGAAAQLSVHCRGGRTELVIAWPGLPRSGDIAAMSWRVAGGQDVPVGAGAPSTGSGVAFAGDVVRLLGSLPDQGEMTVRLSTRQGGSQEANFSIGGFRAVRDKVAVACKWPPSGAVRN